MTSLELLLASSEERLGVLQALGEEVPVGGSKGGGEVEKEVVSGEKVISYAWSLLKGYKPSYIYALIEPPILLYCPLY